MRLFVSLFFSIVFLLFNSCKKDVFYNTFVSGIVTDEKSGLPLQNIEVELFEVIIYGYGGDRSDPISVKTAITDAEGKYIFKYKSSKKKKANKGIINFFENNIIYVLSIKDSRYYGFAKDVYDVEQRKKSVLSNNRNYEVNASIIPLTYIKYKYKNVSPYNDYDELKIATTLESIIIKGKNNEGFTNPNICGYNTMEDLRNYRVFWSVIKNNQTNSYTEFVNCAIGDTTTVEINY